MVFNDDFLCISFLQVLFTLFENSIQRDPKFSNSANAMFVFYYKNKIIRIVESNKQMRQNSCSVFFLAFMSDLTDDE